MEIVSDDEEEVVFHLTDDNKPTALEKMISLIALLLEKSRGPDNQLSVTSSDYNAIMCGGRVSAVFFMALTCFSHL